MSSHLESKTIRPFEYLGSSDYPDGVYNGHDLRRANMDVIYAVGRTPREAVVAFCRARVGVDPTSIEPLDVEEGSDVQWGRRFTVDGTSCKAAGVYMPGGVVLTWWK